MALSGGKTGRSSAEKKCVATPHTRLDNDKQFEEIYKTGRELGSGSFGTVFEVWHQETREHWACKCINRENKESKVKMLLEWEIHILKKVQHAHIIRLNEVFETPKTTYLIMEFCGGGNLKSILESAEKGHFSEEDTKIVVQRLASALSYLHKNDIVHRDIKLENILLSENPDNKEDKLYVKVTDFGLSIVKDGVGPDNMLVDFCGTLIYMAPEIINNKAYSEKCDVWALGVIKFMLLCGKPPFTSNDDTELYEIIRQADLQFKGSVWSSISSEAKDCLQRMLQANTGHRLTAGEVLQQAWITGKPLDGQPNNVLDMMKQMRQEEIELKEAVNGGAPKDGCLTNNCDNSQDEAGSGSGPPSRASSAEAKPKGKNSGGSTRSSLPKVAESTKPLKKSSSKTSLESLNTRGNTLHIPSKNGQPKGISSSKSPVSRDGSRGGPSPRTKPSTGPSYHTARTPVTKTTGGSARGSATASNTDAVKPRRKIS